MGRHARAADMRMVRLDEIQIGEDDGYQVLDPCHPLRGVPCFVCRQALGAEPFVVTTFTEMVECPCGAGHLPVTALPRHTRCRIYDGSHALEFAERAMCINDSDRRY